MWLCCLSPSGEVLHRAQVLDHWMSAAVQDEVFCLNYKEVLSEMSTFLWSCGKTLLKRVEQETATVNSLLILLMAHCNSFSPTLTPPPLCLFAVFLMMLLLCTDVLDLDVHAACVHVLSSSSSALFASATKVRVFLFSVNTTIALPFRQNLHAVSPSVFVSLLLVCP